MKSKKIKQLVDSLLYSYSTLLFMHNRYLGLVLLAITFVNHNIAIHGLIAWFTTILFTKLLNLKTTDSSFSIYSYNSLLVGFSIGFIFKISALSVLMTMTASVLTILLSFTMFSLFSYYLRLPVLNIPFTIISTLIYLASARYSSLIVDSFFPFEHLNFTFLPASLHGLFQSFGVLLFLPYDLIGIIILISILIYSRIAFFLSVFSYFIGITFLALYKGSFALAYADVSSFNFILIGIAIGGVFLIPSKKSYLFALLGVLASIFVLDAVSVFWSSFGIPVFTLPFNLIVLLFLYLLNTIKHPKVNLSIKDSPEKSLLNYLNYNQRFDFVTPKPHLPFSGKWNVYQAFDDEWTHKGPWKYAYDFVIKDEKGNTFSSKGNKLSHYYCFGKPVLAPISGTVVEAYDLLPDNPIGIVDDKKNWGNHVIIYSSLGYYIEISHLQNKTLKVKTGDFVTVGAILGNCGNSGYSPQPHIHIQLQYVHQLGSKTYPFYFGNAADEKGSIIQSRDLRTDEFILPVNFSRKLKRKLQFLLDDTYSYIIYKNKVELTEIKIKIGMEIDGSYYFSLENDKLYFGFYENEYVIYNFDGKKNSFLKMLFCAIPKIPLTDEKYIVWKEVLPDLLFLSSHNAKIIAKSLHPNLHKIQADYEMQNNEIQGKFKVNGEMFQSKIIFHKIKGFLELILSIGNDEYRWQLIDKGV